MPRPAGEEIESMSQFKKREKAFEDNFKREQELGFKFQARRNKLLGLGTGLKM